MIEIFGLFINFGSFYLGSHLAILFVFFKEKYIGESILEDTLTIMRMQKFKGKVIVELNTLDVEEYDPSVTQQDIQFKKQRILSFRFWIGPITFICYVLFFLLAIFEQTRKNYWVPCLFAPFGKILDQFILLNIFLKRNFTSIPSINILQTLSKFSTIYTHC